LCSVDLDGSVSFLFSCYGVSATTVKDMEVTAAGQTGSFTWDASGGNDAEHGIFTATTWSFTADSAATQLQFTSEDASGSYCGPVVAAISVTKN